MVKVFCDGSSTPNPGIMSIGYSIEVEGKRKDYSLKLGEGTNNQAEYLAFIFAILTASTFDKHVHVYTDSQLLANQLNDIWKVKDKDLMKLWCLANEIVQDLEDFEITWIPREENKLADKLSNA